MTEIKFQKILLCLMLISVLFLSSGCLIYGTGESYGYVTTVEQGLVWNKAWFRAELESSQTDCYITSPIVVNELKEFTKNKQRAKITYQRHFITSASQCLDDEIIKIEKIEEGEND